jgi:hypothetical protein
MTVTFWSSASSWYDDDKTVERRYGVPMSIRSLVGLFSGLFLLDVLVNLCRFAPAHPLGSLLAPSIDLLVVAALLWGAAQAGERARKPLRIVTCVLLVILLCLEAAIRFGADIPLNLLGGGGWLGAAAGCLLCLSMAAAAGGLAYAASGLVVRGFNTVMIRSVFMAVVAVLAVLQVVTGHRLFEPSEIPRMFRAFINGQ